MANFFAIVAATLLVTVIAGPVTSDQCAQYTTVEGCEDEAPDSWNCIWTYVNSAAVCRTRTCADIVNGAECAVFGCTWMEDIYYCLANGTKVPCNRYSGLADKCTANGCLFDNTVGFCYASGETIPCSMYYSGATCPASRCDFHYDVGICTDKGAGVPCNFFFGSSQCSGANCQWFPSPGICLPKGSSVPCAYFYQQENCPVASCDWVAGANTCVPKGELLACEQYISTADACPVDRCIYDPQLRLCWPKGKQIACHNYYTEQLCDPLSYCQWVNGGGVSECIDCPVGKNCSVPYVGPTPYTPTDSGLPCSAYTTYDKCPDPRCVFSWTDEASGRCRDATCEDEYDQQRCHLNNTCAWDVITQSCYAAGGSVKCVRYYDSSTCPKDRCTWDSSAYVCYDKGSTLGCNYYPSQTTCPSGRCTWFSSVQRCLAAGTTPPCDEYFDQTSCSTEGTNCQWVANMGCWDKGKDIPCSRYYNQALCDGTGRCQFDPRTYTCSPCASIPCTPSY